MEPISSPFRIRTSLHPFRKAVCQLLRHRALNVNGGVAGVFDVAVLEGKLLGVGFVIGIYGQDPFLVDGYGVGH
jgi:hypothetical protein